MRIGYPCINRSIGCSANRTFRLASYSEDRLLGTVAGNIACLRKILAWNQKNDILFFRITSDLVPFASHPVCTFPWQEQFREEFAATGTFIKEAGIRISMHPDQFIVLNSPDERVVSRSIDELAYHARVLDAMGLDASAKIQLHVGGVYGDPVKSIARFVRVYGQLDPAILRRLVVENDDQRFTASDCLEIHELTGIPVLFDVFHHTCRNNGEDLDEIIPAISKTWQRSDGTMMADYSSQHPEKRAGSHAEHIDITDFKKFLAISRATDMDIMLEIKDKENSALAAVALARADPRFA
ncbi:UV DNA damage repair endonuclease UvsE [Methanoregula sp.]|uniref:UV DNA damage repair endonuclease UvsE n=1 Tax=Methanoregula sp. TaxID=2052170 RepID=UPI00236ED120|nr:UV DNA damage repair endonuclease UvsE [Methanoregula sp.]MDD1686081.1 UV DNA damage repair endonuclease UvsE [Methanoregula sp.]